MNMSGWNLAGRLAWMEIRASLRSTAFLFLFFLAMGVIFAAAFEVYAEGDFPLYDPVFLMILFLFPAWMKGKDFQMVRMGGDLWTVPAIIMLQQLAVTKETIIKSRFLIYLGYSFSFQLLLLAALPLVSAEFREMMTPLTYLAFLLIWLSLSAAIGLAMAASEAGGNYPRKSFIIAWVQILGALIVLYLVWRFLLHDGFLMLTIRLAQDWPIISSAAAIVLAVAGWNWWQYKMKRYMNNADY